MKLLWERTSRCEFLPNEWFNLFNILYLNIARDACYSSSCAAATERNFTIKKRKCIDHIFFLINFSDLKLESIEVLLTLYASQDAPPLSSSLYNTTLGARRKRNIVWWVLCTTERNNCRISPADRAIVRRNTAEEREGQEWKEWTTRGRTGVGSGLGMSGVQGWHWPREYLCKISKVTRKQYQFRKSKVVIGWI